MNGNRCLLIAEDEPELLEILHEFCLSVTDNIHLARNGQEALDIFDSGGVDAILSDLNMPKMNGLQLLAEVRSSDAEIPFIVLTGYGDKSSATEALRLGATDFLAKPFDSEHLLSLVEASLELGAALKMADQEVDLAYKDSQLAPEKLKELKKARRALWVIKTDFAIRKKFGSVG